MLMQLDKAKREREDYIGDNIQEIAQLRREERKKEFEDIRGRLM